MKISGLILLILMVSSCNTHPAPNSIPVIGFLDAFQDPTIQQAKQGFYDALEKNGYSQNKGTVKIIYRNAQGDIPTLTQAMDYFISQNVRLIAANTTLSMITAVQKTKKIPVFMMVAPSPELAHLLDKNGHPPANLYGVYETLNYIDTSVMLMKKFMPGIHRLGTVFNQAEPQSQKALAMIGKACKALGITLVALPVDNSSETQLVVQALLSKKIDAFFAMPDNTVFASFATIAQACKLQHIPIFTSEAGLVQRGAVAAFGADIYQWGYQAGLQAVRYLKQGNLNGLHPALVQMRRRVYNPLMAQEFHLVFDSTFTPLNR
ncbi:MAG: ABC transporter substrate-binding protein [Chitinophagaceae bacterium]